MKREVDVSGYTPRSFGRSRHHDISPQYKRRNWLKSQSRVCCLCHKTVWAYGDEVVSKDIADQATIDHLVPLSLGGLDLPSNWLVMCRACNEEKGKGVLISSLPLAPNETDLTGWKFGRMTVKGKFAKRASDGARWVVQCDCGNCEVRAAKKIKNPIDPCDCCKECKTRIRGGNGPRK